MRFLVDRGLQSEPTGRERGQLPTSWSGSSRRKWLHRDGLIWRMRWDNWFWNELHRRRCCLLAGRRGLDNRRRDRSHHGRHIRLWELSREQEIDLGLGHVRGLGDERSEEHTSELQSRGLISY